MTTIKRVLPGILLASLLACNSPKSNPQPVQQTIQIEDRVLYPKTALSPLFDSLQPPKQIFTISGNRDTLLVSKNGTTFTINKNTFINAKGQQAKVVDITLLEAGSVADFITANLQTVSGDAILQTAGMFFIDAKENGKSLTLANNKSIYVELPSAYKDQSMKIFEGKFNDKDQINWTAVSTPENNLIPIPLKLLNFNKCLLECAFSEKQIRELCDPTFENTFIATREFEDRCCAMSVATCDWFNGLDQKLLDIYKQNINKPLYYSDSLVVEHFRNNYKNKIDTTVAFDWRETGWITYMYQSFTDFKNQHCGNSINFAKLGIDENSTSAQLITKGYSEKEAEKIITWFKTRKHIIESRESEKQTARLATYAFSINKLGWTNVDKFMNERDDQNLDPSDLLVQVNSKDTLDIISVSLVIPNYNIAVFPIWNAGNQYSFTKKQDGYRKLPIGQEAIIVAFSYKDNIPYFGKQKIKIPTGGLIQVTLEKTTEQSIKRAITTLTK